MKLQRASELWNDYGADFFLCETEGVHGRNPAEEADNNQGVVQYTRGGQLNTHRIVLLLRFLSRNTIQTLYLSTMHSGF